MAELNLKAKLTVAPEITALELTEDKKVSIGWKRVPLAEKYEVTRSTSASGDFVRLDWTKENSFIDATAEADTTYWYKIVAQKPMEGKKTSRKASTVRPIVISDIPCVKDVSACICDGSIRLSWDKSGTDKCFIYRRCDFFSRPVCVGQEGGGSFVDGTAVSGQIYHYSLQSVKLGSRELHGNFSKEISCAFVDKAEILSTRVALGGRAVIEVRVIAGADGYIFERSEKKDGEFIQVGVTEDITAVTFEQKLPSRLRNYYYRVCAFKKAGDKEYRGEYSEIKSLR